MNLSPNFTLRELIPRKPAPLIPLKVLDGLWLLTTEILQPARDLVRMKIRVTSGWRPRRINQLIGGNPNSDHLRGAAADIQGMNGEFGHDWVTNTRTIFNQIRYGLEGRYGQLIFEDHRRAMNDPNKLWVHVSLPTERHPGTDDDINRLLVTNERDEYMPWKEGLV